MFRDLRFIWIFEFSNFCIFKVFGCVSIETQIMDGPAGLFLQDEYFISYITMK